MTTLLDLVRDVQDSLYSYTQVKDKFLYLSAEMSSLSVDMALTAATEVQVGQVLQLSSDDSAVSELVRVKSVNRSTNVATVARAIRGTNVATWPVDTTTVQVEPEYPISAIVREINREIVSLPPNIWAIATETTTVDDAWRFGYTLPVGAVSVLSVKFEPVGYDGDAWADMRRWDFDSVNRIVTIPQSMDPGAPLKITYRAYPTELSADADDLSDAGLEDQLGELILMGATYRLLMKRAPGRLIDTAAQTPLNGQYRQADPVNSAVRQLYAMYQERLDSERRRQMLLFPPRPHFTF